MGTLSYPTDRGTTVPIEYLVTRIDVLTAETTCLCRETEQEIAQATFQAACMDLNVTVPTPILFESNTAGTLALLNAMVLFPGNLVAQWRRNRDVEPQFETLFAHLTELHDVIEGYTKFGQQILDDEANNVTEVEID